MEKLPTVLLSLISHLKKLPGVGQKTAERFAFELLGWSQEELFSCADLLKRIQDEIPPCQECGCLSDKGKCFFCPSPNRDSSELCIIASARDAFSIEATKSYRGLYHVIEHLLSPLDGRHTSTLRLDRIEERITKNHVCEVILAFDSTLEGDTTALYLKKYIGSHREIKISRLAFGLPVGSSLEYIDGGTLTRALSGRQNF